MSTRDYKATVLGYVEETRIVMQVHKSREDQMGNTTRDVVLVAKTKPLTENELQAAIEGMK